MGSRKKKSQKAQVAASNASTTAASIASASSAPASPAPSDSNLSHPSSTVNHINVPVDSNVPLAEQRQQTNDNNDYGHGNGDEDEQQHLLQPQEPARSRNPQRSPTLPTTEVNGYSHPHSSHSHDHNHDHNHSHSYNHSHDHGSGHVHGPQSVDGESIIHTIPRSSSSSTPLKQSLGQSYGSTRDANPSNDSENNDSAMSPQRSLTPPPIACKGVLITNESTKNKRKLIFVTILCLCFFTVEMVGGYFARSLALMSDAFHLLSDVVSFMISLVAIWLSEQPATKRHSFGYHRAEVLAALMSVFIIWILTAFLLMEAVERIRNPETIDGKTMCLVASIGVAINIILAFALGHDHGHDHGHGHGHGHGHSHEHNHEHNHSHSHDHGDSNASKAAAAQKKVEVNINVKAATLHVIGDLISSVGVLVASIVIMVKPSWTIVDPICTVFFSILVLFTTYRLVWDSLGILMEGTPTHIDPEEIEKSLLDIPGVTLVHDLHVWNLTAGKVCHI
ncbi:hypothetical protein BX616_008314 [Lobosporangium transversale]|nr:hypothetical protein BX616_008314 [Lobosporangium transversale]